MQWGQICILPAQREDYGVYCGPGNELRGSNTRGLFALWTRQPWGSAREEQKDGHSGWVMSQMAQGALKSGQARWGGDREGGVLRAADGEGPRSLSPSLHLHTLYLDT